MVVVGLTGSTRSGKGWVAKALQKRLAETGVAVCVVGQDNYWERPVPVSVGGKERLSEEEPRCTNHQAFATAILAASSSYAVVVAEGFQLLHCPDVVRQLTSCYCLELPREEARERRTQARDGKLNPNPLSTADFDDLAWPAHERYLAVSVAPLIQNGKVVQLPSPHSEEDVSGIVSRILVANGMMTAAKVG